MQKRSITLKILKTATLAVTLVCLGACSSSAGNSTFKNITATDIERSIHDGVTTASQLRQLYGEPSETAFENGTELWTYGNASSQEDGLSIAQDAVGLSFLGTRSASTTHVLKVTLRRDVVIHHSFITSHVNGGSGLRQ